MLTSFNWSWGSKLFWQRYVTDSLISEILVPTPPNHSMTTVSNCFGHPGLHFSGLLWKCPGFACQRLLVGWQIVFEMCVCNCFWCFWSRVMSEVSSVGDQCLSDRSSRVLDQPWRQKGLEQKRDRSVEAGERKPRSSRCIIRRRISSKSILARRISIIHIIALQGGYPYCVWWKEQWSYLSVSQHEQIIWGHPSIIYAKMCKHCMHEVQDVKILLRKKNMFQSFLIKLRRYLSDF